MGSLRSLQHEKEKHRHTAYKYLYKEETETVALYRRYFGKKISWILLYGGYNKPISSRHELEMSQMVETIPKHFYGKIPYYDGIYHKRDITFQEAVTLINEWWDRLDQGKDDWWKIIEFPTLWDKRVQKHYSHPELSVSQVINISMGKKIDFKGIIFPV